MWQWKHVFSYIFQNELLLLSNSNDKYVKLSSWIFLLITHFSLYLLYIKGLPEGSCQKNSIILLLLFVIIFIDFLFALMLFATLFFLCSTFLTFHRLILNLIIIIFYVYLGCFKRTVSGLMKSKILTSFIDKFEIFRQWGHTC